VSAAVLERIEPPSGPATGGALVRVIGRGFDGAVSVAFGGRPATLVSVRDEGGLQVAYARTPTCEPSPVDVSLQCASGTANLAKAYRFERAPIVAEHTLTRVVRQLLRDLKRCVLANVSTAVSIDYDDSSLDGLRVTALASLPSLVVTGPTVRLSRAYATNALVEQAVLGPAGPEIVRRRSPSTVDLAFGVTGAAERTVELLNLLAAVGSFLNTTPWLTLLRDDQRPELGSVRWELDADGEARTQLGGSTEVRSFTWGLLIRGFDLDEGLPFDVTSTATGGASLGVGHVPEAP